MREKSRGFPEGLEKGASTARTRKAKLREAGRTSVDVTRRQSRAELTLSKKADSTTGAGRNKYRLTPLAEAVLAVIGTTSPNLLGIEGVIDTDQVEESTTSMVDTDVRLLHEW
ncbi:hypothetical protein HPB47_027097 [Ixodes persulcatus]|uniref:Uncharacterized protein n=1 Tax=Ixodes persulcatus TaxID=34615 RepID=A0AC60PYU6_IXOPE|nr:hypothetical protein HPB47_027097 [Ixodes persulcatus]